MRRSPFSAVSSNNPTNIRNINLASTTFSFASLCYRKRTLLILLCIIGYASNMVLQWHHSISTLASTSTSAPLSTTPSNNNNNELATLEQLSNDITAGIPSRSRKTSNLRSSFDNDNNNDNSNILYHRKQPHVNTPKRFSKTIPLSKDILGTVKEDIQELPELPNTEVTQELVQDILNILIEKQKQRRKQQAKNTLQQSTSDSNTNIDKPIVPIINTPPSELSSDIKPTNIHNIPSSSTVTSPNQDTSSTIPVSNLPETTETAQPPSTASSSTTDNPVTTSSTEPSTSSIITNTIVEYIPPSVDNQNCEYDPNPRTYEIRKQDVRNLMHNGRLSFRTSSSLYGTNWCESTENQTKFLYAQGATLELMDAVNVHRTVSTKGIWNGQVPATLKFPNEDFLPFEKWLPKFAPPIDNLRMPNWDAERIILLEQYQKGKITLANLKDQPIKQSQLQTLLTEIQNSKKSSITATTISLTNTSSSSIANTASCALHVFAITNTYYTYVCEFLRSAILNGIVPI